MQYIPRPAPSLYPIKARLSIPNIFYLTFSSISQTAEFVNSNFSPSLKVPLPCFLLSSHYTTASRASKPQAALDLRRSTSKKRRKQKWQFQKDFIIVILQHKQSSTQSNRQCAKAEGMDKAYEICMRMFEAELEAHRSELETVSNERDELVNRYRWRYWKS